LRERKKLIEKKSKPNRRRKMQFKKQLNSMRKRHRLTKIEWKLINKKEIK